MKQFFFILCLLIGNNLSAQSDTIYKLTVIYKDSLMTFQETRSQMSYDQLVFLLEAVYQDAIRERDEAIKQSRRTNAKRSKI